MWRSEEMSYMRLFVPGEAAHAFVDEVCRRGIMQFVDLNEGMQTFQRRYIRDIISINDVSRLLEGIERYLDSYEVPYEADNNYLDCESVSKESVDGVLRSVKEYHGRLLNDFHVAQEFRSQLQQEQELENVLEKSRHYLGQQASAIRGELRSSVSERGRDSLLGDIEAARNHAVDAVAFRFIAGIISKSQKPTFERQVFLASRGNAYTIFVDVRDEEKETFVVFFLGENLDRKLNKLCQVMSINVYLRPEDQEGIPAKLSECRNRQSEIRETLYKTETQLRQDLFGVSSRIGSWKRILQQGRLIYSTLNQFRLNDSAQMLQVEGWIPAPDQILVRDCLRIALDSRGFNQGSHPAVVQEIPLEPSEDNPPPTFFRTNKFTALYQEIVDTYGIPRYGEVNPGVFTIVTFPFLFGVMYGDVFHGSFLFLFSLMLILLEDKLSKKPLNEFLSATFNGRYVLVLMGFFAIYCGFIYNDFTSMPLRLFSSKYDSVAGKFDGVYPFGVDWMWYGAEDELAFLNSLKMKLSIVIGVTQMTVGIFLSLCNHIHFKDWPSIVCEFIPQLLFMLSFFGYMVFLIIFKWCTDFETFVPIASGLEPHVYTPGTHNAPNLISVLIDMVLKPGNVAMPIYHGQAGMQVFLLLTMFVCVPWMLLPKPFLLRYLHNKRRSDLQRASGAVYAPLAAEPLPPDNSSDDERRPSDQPRHQQQEHQEQEFEMSEVMVHQIIHTIEFVLSCVSNTASYLRLWALSLAHAQLASVFFSKLLAGQFGSVFGIFIGFSAFAAATFAVLLAMDVLECFLHALRLHWVEFQSKFYNADGISFEPVSYSTLAVSD